LKCPVFKQVPLVSLADEGDCSLSAPRLQSMSSIELVQLPELLFQGLQEYRLTHPADSPLLDSLQRRFLELSFKLRGLLFPFRVFIPFSNRYRYRSMPLLMLDFDPCGSLDQFLIHPHLQRFIPAEEQAFKALPSWSLGLLEISPYRCFL